MSSKEVPSGRSGVRYAPEFKADAVAMTLILVASIQAAVGQEGIRADALGFPKVDAL
jgi:transposase-like protein